MTERGWKNTVLHGDCITLLPYIPENSIHLTVTSPPYFNAKEYASYETYASYLHFLETVFQAVYRVTAEGRFCIVNTSPVIIPRTSRSDQSQRLAIPFDVHTIMNRIGWDFIDDIVWVKPDGSAKNRNGNFFQHRRPLGYKPNSVAEYVMVYRKHTDRLIDWNMRQYSNEVIQQSLVHHRYFQTNVWKISPESSNVHPAIFPERLVRELITLYSYYGDLILDPFGGIGTVGRVASQLQRYFLLIEQKKEYIHHFLHEYRSRASSQRLDAFLTDTPAFPNYIPKVQTITDL